MRLVYIKSLGKIGIKTESDFIILTQPSSVLRPNEQPRTVVVSSVACEENFIVCPLSDLVPIYSPDEVNFINTTIEHLKEESEKFIEKQKKEQGKQIIQDVVDNIASEGKDNDS